MVATLRWNRDNAPQQLESGADPSRWPADRRLEYACAGHPPALLVDAVPGTVQPLKAKGVPIGLVPQVKYESAVTAVPPNARLYLLSDGTYEVEKPDGGMLTVEDLAQFMRRAPAGAADLDDWWKYLQQLHGSPALEDDYSIVRFQF